MDKNIYERIQNVGITMAIYTFILAWDNIIKENEAKKSPDNDTGNEIDVTPSLPVITDDELFFNKFWERKDLSYDLMLAFATKFLKRKLKFDNVGEKLPHTIYNKTRKTLYPVQMDIVDYFWETKLVKILYAENSIQSKVSRELEILSGRNIEASILKANFEAAVVCTKRQYKPYAISDKRKSIIEKIVHNINAVDDDNHLIFAHLKKDIVYQLGNGGVVIFFDDQAHLKGTISFLKRYVGDSYICDIFEIKGRLILLLDGTEQEIADAMNDLSDLVDRAYSAQNPVRKSIKIQ